MSNIISTILLGNYYCFYEMVAKAAFAGNRYAVYITISALYSGFHRTSFPRSKCPGFIPLLLLCYATVTKEIPDKTEPRFPGGVSGLTAVKRIFFQLLCVFDHKPHDNDCNHELCNRHGKPQRICARKHGQQVNQQSADYKAACN